VLFLGVGQRVYCQAWLVKNLIYLKKYALSASDLFRGAKSGSGCGMRSNIAVNAADGENKMARKLLWHTHDLRLHDHRILASLGPEDALLPVYCFDPTQLEPISYPPGIPPFPKMGTLRLQFLVEHLRALRAAYQQHGQNLIVRIGDPRRILPDLAAAFDAHEIWTPEAFTFEELQMQSRVRNALLKTGQPTVPLRTFSAALLLDDDALPFSLQQLPRSFTGFRKKVEARGHFPAPLPAPLHLPSVKIKEGQDPLQEGDLPTPESFGFAMLTPDARTAFPFEGGEIAALEHMHHYIWEVQHLASYKETRNGLVGASFSSKFSPWLASGALSARQVYAEIKAFEQRVTANDSTYWLVFELLWRDYFRLVAAQHGSAIFKSGGIQQRAMHYANPAGAFEDWIQGQTQNAFVNACMHELRLTGYLSNRGRQNAASYLCHDLQVDWRWGAAWFEHCLLDYDPCSNWGNWMYIAGVGNGGPNRRFDVQSQADFYDSQGVFQALWNT
jgi:deoxyribodipyrimidine photo-lyase